MQIVLLPCERTADIDVGLETKAIWNYPNSNLEEILRTRPTLLTLEVSSESTGGELCWKIACAAGMGDFQDHPKMHDKAFVACTIL